MVKVRKSRGNSYSVFFSPEGWQILTGDNIPSNHPAAWCPGGSLESTVGYPISPIRPIRPILPQPKSTLAHPKSTVDLGCESLIRVENSLISTLLRTSYRPISTPKIRGLNQTQTVTDRKILCRLPLIQVASFDSFVAFCGNSEGLPNFLRPQFVPFVRWEYTHGGPGAVSIY
jgi:hypothetical protein